MCTQMGIDYAYLWVWNPDAEAWWSDPAVTQFQCDAYDHLDDNEFWGTEVYSGLFLNDFLVPGQYQFLLGFYAKGVPPASDMLLYEFSAGAPGDENTGVLEADGVGTTNFWWAIFPTTDQVFGVLKIALKWGTAEGTFYDTCADSTVKTMGFLLQNDGWIAAEVPLSDGGDCLDGLEFDKVPVLETPYELIVSALSVDDEFLWHHSCGDLIPEVDVTPETAVGYTCEIANQLNQ